MLVGSSFTFQITNQIRRLGLKICRSPALPAPRLDFYKAQVLDSLDHQNDDADAIANR
jgi:hypothetical protein